MRPAHLPLPVAGSLHKLGPGHTSPPDSRAARHLSHCRSGEAAITVPGGTVSRTAIDRIAPVEGGDLLLVVDVDNAAKCEQPPGSQR